MKDFIVVLNPESCVEPCIVPQLLLYEFIAVFEVFEDRFIRDEGKDGALVFVGLDDFRFGFDFTLVKGGFL